MHFVIACPGHYRFRGQPWQPDRRCSRNRSDFAYPGIGKMVVDSIRSRDYPVIQGYLLVMAIIVFMVNSAVDLSYRYLNPELRLKERKHGKWS